MSELPEQTPTFDTAKFRQVLGHFPTGVTGITAMNEDPFVREKVDELMKQEGEMIKQTVDAFNKSGDVGALEAGIRRAVTEQKCPNCWTPCEAYPAIGASPGRALLALVRGR